MKERENSFFRELGVLMGLSLFTGLIGVIVFFQEGRAILAYLSGALLALLNFFTLKKEGSEMLRRVYQNVMHCIERPYQRERTFFLIKTYLRLLALGIIFYFLIGKLQFHPVLILLGFTLIYIQIFVLVFRNWVRGRKFL